VGDGRQKQLMGIAEKDGSGMEVVVDVMKIFLDRRRSALANLFKKQSGPGGGGVNNAQVNQAIRDYETAKKQAMEWGIAVANAPEMPDQPFDAKQQSGGQ